MPADEAPPSTTGPAAAAMAPKPKPSSSMAKAEAAYEERERAPAKKSKRASNKDSDKLDKLLDSDGDAYGGAAGFGLVGSGKGGGGVGEGRLGSATSARLDTARGGRLWCQDRRAAQSQGNCPGSRRWAPPRSPARSTKRSFAGSSVATSTRSSSAKSGRWCGGVVRVGAESFCALRLAGRQRAGEHHPELDGGKSGH
jgi:hypothetical protein